MFRCNLDFSECAAVTHKKNPKHTRNKRNEFRWVFRFDDISMWSFYDIKRAIPFTLSRSSATFFLHVVILFRLFYVFKASFRYVNGKRPFIRLPFERVFRIWDLLMSVTQTQWQRQRQSWTCFFSLYSLDKIAAMHLYHSHIHCWLGSARLGWVWYHLCAPKTPFVFTQQKEFSHRKQGWSSKRYRKFGYFPFVAFGS